MRANKRFLSNRSLIGVQHNTKELTRIINTSGMDQIKDAEFMKTISQTGDHRPQTTQCFNTKSKMKRSFYRPASQANKNSGLHGLSHAMPMFDQNRLLPPYRNLVLSESPTRSQGKTKFMFNKKAKKLSSKEKAYKEMKNKMIHKMNIEKQNPNLLNEGCKTFYWSPDLSFCAFATEQQIRKTAQLWRKNRRIDSGQRMNYIMHNSREQKKMLQNIALIPQITEELGS